MLEHFSKMLILAIEPPFSSKLEKIFLTVAVPEIWNILENQKMVEKNARTVLKFQSLL